MSLLEDVFLQDEAGEAQELERIIEGDDYDERPRDRSSDSDENSEKEDEAEEDKRRVDPASTKTKHVVKNPRFILNPARVTGPRGIQVIPEHFKDFKFKGTGHEKEDLDLLLKKLEHWAYRLYPKFNFEDCLKKIETLGKKRPVMVHLHKIRSDQLVTEETVVQQDSSDDEAPPPEEDEFDKLLAQQIALVRNTPGPNSAKKPGFVTPLDKISPITMPKATSSPSISEEQKERMLRNRKLAEERRLNKLKAQTQNGNTVDLSNDNINQSDTTDKDFNNDNDDTVTANDDVDVEDIRTKKNRSHIIDSSDSENDMVIDENVKENDDVIDKVIDITNGYESINKMSKNTDDVTTVGTSNDVIDITNGYQSKERVTKENNNVFTVDPKIVDITQAQNKSNSIETNEIIDLNEHEDIISENKRPRSVRRSNVFDSSDSDDEDAVTGEYQSITVDVHKTTTQNDNTVIVTNNRDSDNKNDAHDNDASTIQKDDMNKDSEAMKDDTVEDTLDCGTEPTLNTDTSTSVSEIIKEIIILTKKTNENPVQKKDNDNEENQLDDELMDVEFSDDF